MSKITLIAEREFMTRVRKRSFIIMSILGPILFAALIVVPVWVSRESSESLIVQVVDESRLFVNKLKESENLKFIYADVSLDESKKKLNEKGKKKAQEVAYDGILHIPAMDLETPKGITYFSEKSLSAFTQREIEDKIAKEIENQKLVKSGIDKNVLDKITTKVDISTISLSQEGEKKSNSIIASGVGYISAFLIYMFIFLYGSQVMRGVIEEKTSRIVEVIISSVKPFELMMGKILGIAGVALLQFLIWVGLSFVVNVVVSLVFGLDSVQANQIGASGQIPPEMQDNFMAQYQNGLSSLNVPLLVFSFGFYFLFGYLMYGALFGAIGSAVDNETDSQQLVLPITIPLILSIVMISAVLNNPNGALAFWFSVIPLTSPVVMMVRLPFIGFSWELILSMSLLVMGFLGATWVAGRIYRVGILMYGKKPSFKELGKWLFYKV
jgi:ABC-2 type transport system permease protein